MGYTAEVILGFSIQQDLVRRTEYIARHFGSADSRAVEWQRDIQRVIPETEIPRIAKSSKTIYSFTPMSSVLRTNARLPETITEWPESVNARCSGTGLVKAPMTIIIL